MLIRLQLGQQLIARRTRRFRGHGSILARPIRTRAFAYELFTAFSHSPYRPAPYGWDMDIVFLALTAAFFGVSIGYVAACERLMTSRSRPSGRPAIQSGEEVL